MRGSAEGELASGNCGVGWLEAAIIRCSWSMVIGGVGGKDGMRREHWSSVMFQGK